MSKISTAKTAAALTASALALVVAPASAQAAQATSTASASLGEVDIVVGGTPATAEPIAPCDVAGPANNTSRGTDVGTTTEYGSGQTTCARDDAGVSSAKAAGQRFETDVLEQFGGPSIRVRTYSAECHTTDKGSSASMELSGVTGFDVPSEIPPNHTVLIPGAEDGDPPMAKIVINELIAPTPADGSLTTHALHITLFPEGGPGSGDVIVGTANCDPFGG